MVMEGKVGARGSQEECQTPALVLGDEVGGSWAFPRTRGEAPKPLYLGIRGKKSKDHFWSLNVD